MLSRLNAMSRSAKIGLVGAGYLLACITGAVASYLHHARLAAMPYDTSGGMYAAGVFMAGLGTFLVAAMVPTLLALWFLRSSPGLWGAIAFGSLAFAIAGLLAVLTPLAFGEASRHPAILMISLLGLAQLLGMPLWTMAFGLFAVIAPTRYARRLLIAAISVELVIGVCAAIHWFVPSSPL